MTDSSVPWADAIALLAADPASCAELATVVGEIQRRTDPCGPEAVIEALAPMLSLYGMARKSPQEATAFWGIYIEVLASLPLEALQGGVREYNSAPTSEFFPKPGPLKAICERHAIPLRMAANRARKALERSA